MKHKKIKDSEFESFIKNEIASISELQLLILKGHVLIEYSMIKFIDACANESFDIYKENFHFSQKVKICKALSLFKSTKYPLEELIITLNTIRNHIAHYLEYEESDLKS